MRNLKIVEDMLRNYKVNVAEVKNLQLEIEELEINYDMPISLIRLEGRISKANLSQEEELKIKKEKLMSLKKMQRYKQIELEKIENALSTLTEREYKITEMRYFNKLSIKEISIKLNLEQSYCSTLKRNILEKIAPLICREEIYIK